MLMLVLGLLLFVGVHSVGIVAYDWRIHCQTRIGREFWKLGFTVISITGFILLVYGYAQTRTVPVYIFEPYLWTRQLALPLNWFALILISAAYIPGNHFKQKLGHPMYAGVKLWALAHLLANGRLGDLLLFGIFLVWAIVGFSVSRRQDRRDGVLYAPANISRTAITVLAGTAVGAVFVHGLHQFLMGVSPL